MCYMTICLGGSNIRFVFLLEVSQLVDLGLPKVYIFVAFSSCVAYSTHLFPIVHIVLYYLPIKKSYNGYKKKKKCEHEVEINVKYWNYLKCIAIKWKKK